MQESYAFEAHSIAVRLVQSVPQLQLAGMKIPSGPGVGDPVDVLGVSFIPNWAGVNGPRGFSEGTVELRLYEEGSWGLSFANGPGDDGVRHLDRFLIVSTGKVTPLGGNVTTYEGGAFRPGDEYLEIYRTSAAGAPGDPFFVGATTKAAIDGGSIKLEGEDALWLGKKTRETAAGFFVNAPRDVCEHYTKTWQVVAASDFPQDGSFDYVGGGSPQASADGQWTYVDAWNVPAATDPSSSWSSALGTVLRLGPTATNGGHLTVAASIPVSFSQRPDICVRWEARVRWVDVGPGGGAQAITLDLGNGTQLGVFGFGSLAGQATLHDSGSVPAGKNQSAVFQMQGFAPTSWHTLALELRDRYLFGYVDGSLVGVIASPGAVDDGVTWSSAAAAGSSPSISVGGCADVDYALLRQKVPTFLRPSSPALLGDFALGGLPKAGACLLEVWHADDIGAAGVGVPYGVEFSPGRLSQFTGKTSIGSPALAQTYVQGSPAWWPGSAGVWWDTGWAARATGSLYLTLGTYDYRFRCYCNDGARLWVAKTRFGEQVIDNWTTLLQAGHAAELMTSPYAKASSIAATTLASGVGSTATAISLTSVPAGAGGGQLLRIGSAAPYEYAYAATISGTTVTLRDKIAQAHSSGAAVVFLNQGWLAGLPDGWYPFIFEVVNVPFGGGGGAVLQYERSDQPGWWVNAGASSYTHAVYQAMSVYGGVGAAGAYYWPLTEGLVEQTDGYAEYSHGATAPIAASDAQAIGTTQTTAAFGDCAPLFNGGILAGRTGDYLDAGAIAAPTSAWTVSALLRCDSLTGSYQTVFGKDNALILRIQTSGYIEVYGGSGSAFTVGVNTGVAVNTGTWYHAVATWDGATLRLYVDGVLAASAAKASQGTNGNHAYVGARTSATDFFNGAIGHVLMLPQAMSASDVSALWQDVTSAPHVPCSESGIVDSTQQPYRYASHYDQLLQTVKDWGLQITAEPMQLESGEFPGRLRPLIRVGRDTEYVVGSPQVARTTSSDIQDAITAEEVCDALVADAQGLADPSGAAQIAAEVFAFAEMIGVPTGSAAVPLHPWLSSEYDQSSNIAYPDLLVQRLISLLALRGSPWEQISMAHKPERQLVDTFPLTGAVAEFFWLPGDGVRLDMPELGVVDLSPRQVLGVQWPITPAGLGAPAISLRQRPRNFAQVLRDIFRAQIQARRNYQGQLVALTGSPAGTGLSDTTTRAPLPHNLADVVRATFVVLTKSDPSVWQVSVNGSTTGAPTFRTVGRYDISALVAKVAGAPYFYAGATGGTGSATYMLELVMKT